MKHNKNTLRNVETFLTEFEGYFAEGVSGIFKIIRGFADLRDLAATSVPYEVSAGSEPGQVIGHQRRLNERNRFVFPFEASNRNDKVPFDLSTFKYVPVSQVAEIPNKVKAEIMAIRRDVLVKEHGLSERQSKALNHILKNGSMTIKDFERICPEVNRRSLQTDLRAMVDRGLIITEGETHHLFYRLAEPV